MVKPTSSCETVVLALEAEAYSMDGENIIDPHGGVGILKFSHGNIDGPYTYTALNFTQFNDR